MLTAPEKGLATLETAIRIFPEDLRIHIFLALSYMRMDRHEESLRQFEWIDAAMVRNAAIAKTVQPLFYFWYGQACDRAGHSEACERQIERYLAANPNSGEALNYLAYMWADQGRNLDRAMDYVTKALKMDPDNGAYLDTLGWIYFKKGDAASAVTYLTRAVKREGDAPAIMEHLGDAWYALKKRDKAVSLWLKSLKLVPENQGLRNKLIAEQVEARRLPPVPAKGQVKQTGRFPL